MPESAVDDKYLVPTSESVRLISYDSYCHVLMLRNRVIRRYLVLSKNIMSVFAEDVA